MGLVSVFMYRLLEMLLDVSQGLGGLGGIVNESETLGLSGGVHSKRHSTSNRYIFSQKLFWNISEK